MTGFRRGRDGDEDLVVSARRRALADAERLELDAALEVDPTLRVAHDVGRAFDDVALVRPGDEALVARVVDRTLGLRNRRAASRRWRTGAAVAAGFLLVASAAAAYRAGLYPRARRAPVPVPVNDRHDVASRAPRPKARAASGSEAPPPDLGEPAIAAAALAPKSDPLAAGPTRARPEEGPSIAGPDERPHAPAAPLPNPLPATRGEGIGSGSARLPASRAERIGRAAAPAGALDGNVTAAELFRRAGAARHAGELAAACALYDELQARFPAAEEARLSHVSLGKLLLAMGRPREAEPHFARYLASGAGALAAEAAFGRAQSFEKMGRSRDEREAWRALLRDFPGSVYESAARRRIAALEIPGAGPPEAPTAGPAGAAPGSAP